MFTPAYFFISKGSEVFAHMQRNANVAGQRPPVGAGGWES